MNVNMGARIVAFLTQGTIRRIAVDLGAGVAIAVAVGTSGATPVVLAVLSGACAGALAGWVLLRLLGVVRRLTAAQQMAKAVVRVVAFLVAAALVGLIAGMLVGGLGVPALLPAAFFLVFAGWLVLLVRRMLHGHGRLRYLTDVLVAVLTGIGLLVLCSPDLLATEPAAGLLFPVGAWASVRIWRALARAPQLAARAGTDIVLSLLLGTDLVLLLVWGANLLGLAPGTVEALRATLEHAGALAELPWWVWSALYLVLAVLTVLAAVRRQGTGESLRRRVVSPVNLTRRTLTVVHLALLIGVLIGAAAPVALRSTVTTQLREQYAVALRNRLTADGERAAYTAITRTFTTAPPISVRPLTALVTKVHAVAATASTPQDRTATERELARRAGSTQAAALRTPPAPQAPAPDLSAFTAPLRDGGDLDDRLDRVDAAQHDADDADHQAEQAAELAATAVAGLIQIPDIGENEIVQIVREYLGGLIEGSPLKDVFAAVAHRFGRPDPPRTGDMVVPDPQRLAIAATIALSRTERHVRVAESLASGDPAVRRARREPPIDQATDLLNEARYLEQRTGPCAQCPHPLAPGEDPADVPGVERPVEPEIHVPVR